MILEIRLCARMNRNYHPTHNTSSSRKTPHFEAGRIVAQTHSLPIRKYLLALHHDRSHTHSHTQTQKKRSRQYIYIWHRKYLFMLYAFEIPTNLLNNWQHPSWCMSSTLGVACLFPLGGTKSSFCFPLLNIREAKVAIRMRCLMNW